MSILSNLKYVLPIVGGGGLLGVLVLILTHITKPISDHNKSKWDNIKKDIIDSSCLERIYRGIGIPGGIQSSDMEKLRCFRGLIRRSSEELDFKQIFSKKAEKYRRKLEKIMKLSNKFAGQVDTYWVLDENGEKLVLDIDKFTYTENAQQRIQQHIKELEGLIEEVRKEFRKLSLMANREPFEYFLPWKYWGNV